MTKARPKIDASLKAKMAPETLREQATAHEPVHPNQIYAGRKQLLERAARAFDAKTPGAPLQDLTLTETSRKSVIDWCLIRQENQATRSYEFSVPRGAGGVDRARTAPGDEM